MNTNPYQYTVIIVDDHPIFRKGLSDVLQSDPKIKVLKELSSAKEVLSMKAEEYPQLFILDLSLQGGASGLDLIKSIKQIQPKQHILVFSMHDELIYAERSIRAGATGYLNKSIDFSILSEFVIKACEGKLVVSDAFKDYLIESQIFLKPSAQPQDYSIVTYLSDREIEIFEKLGEGLKSSEIAEQLFLSIKTVDSHLHHIKQKLNLETMNQLICRAAVWVSEQKKS
jgi:DNA-binding NarL/FixJ family response regulator